MSAGLFNTNCGTIYLQDVSLDILVHTVYFYVNRHYLVQFLITDLKRKVGRHRVISDVN